MQTPKPRRCAIYTRKSSEEGLEQDFNSLHAQREACEAFIKSQQGEGWRLIKTAYDDGGLSGGTMERPALQRLLTDIGHGFIDVVVVYKVDRLTRSLADFAKMVEVFDAHEVSFVAVTQQFNTTTSMGRLTLNVLLSFAQFEREVTGERIRDKIAASKRKGMWMGGTVPIGYDVRDRRLVVNEAEAATVREIFQRYLELGCVRLLKEDLATRGVRSKVRISADGNRSGGCVFSRGALYNLLSNPVYVGEVRHRKERHLGQHQAIVEREIWEKAQQMLRDHTVRRERRTAAEPSPLIGKLFDENGERLTPSHAVKGERRYRYYASRSLTTGSKVTDRAGWRLPAPEIERTVAAAAAQMLRDRSAVTLAAEEAGIEPHQLDYVLRAAAECGERLESSSEASNSLSALIDRVDLGSESIYVSIRLLTKAAEGGETAIALKRWTKMKLQRRGVEMRLVIEGESAVERKADPALLKMITRARRWFDDLSSSQPISIPKIAAREKVGERYVRRLIRLALLAPEIVEAVVEGRQPVSLTADYLSWHPELPAEWSDQKRVLGFESV